MLIAHLSDLHVLPEKELLAGKLDTNAMALRAVECINRLTPQPRFCVVTGDLTHHGSIDEMRVAWRILGTLEMPVFPLPGAHDEPAAFREVFGDMDYVRRSEDLCYVADFEDLSLLVLNTTDGKGGMPKLGESRAAWLQGALARVGDRAVAVAVHHPPVPCRIPVAACLADPAAAWADELWSILSGARVELVMCGHVHRAIHCAVGSTLVSVAPATCVQSVPSYEYAAPEPKRRVSLALEPPGYQLYWREHGRIASYGAFVGDFPRVS